MYFILLPLYRAAIVSLLIAGGAEVGAENQEGETPQMYAEYRNHDTVAKLLHEAADQGMGKTDGTLDGLFSVIQCGHGICYLFKQSKFVVVQCKRSFWFTI